MKHRVWVEVDLGVLIDNYRKIAARVKPAKVLSVLKANAYGLGVGPYSKALYDAGCRDFGVAEPFEALELKKAIGDKAQVQILSSVLPDEIGEMVKGGVILPVVDLETAKMISDAAVKAKKTARVHLKLDTGMGRLGILADSDDRLDAAAQVAAQVALLPRIELEGVFSHFPMAYDEKDPFTKHQIALFKRFLREAAKRKLAFKKVHIAASDAINNFPQCAKEPFNMVRTGINLHGSFDPNGRRALKLKSVLTLKTRIAQVRDLPAGKTLGYGRTWCLNENRTVATISAGYADGLPLALTNRGKVIIAGEYCNVIGRISMDYTTVDVSHLKKRPQPGDEVICFGESGRCSITPDDWAALKGTHAYDIICSLGDRVKRVYGN